MSSELSGLHGLVVGGTSGIGEATALELARRGAGVTVSGRNELAGAAIVAQMGELGVADFAFERLDASSLKATRAFAQKITEARGDGALDFLVMCQSTASFGGRQETDEGFELKLVLHAYSRFVLTEELLPLLRRGDAGRVLSVLSGGMHAAFTDWDDADLKRRFSLKRAADAAGFYNDLALQRFADHPDNASVGFLHTSPGFVASKWGHQTKAAFLIKAAQKLFAKSAADCAQIMVGALRDPRYATGFHCVDQHGEPTKTTSAHTPENVAAMQAHLERVYATFG